MTSQNRIYQQNVWNRYEGPTWLVAILIYGGFGTTVVFSEVLGLAVALPILTLLIAWQSSLTHECVHGHPTKNVWLNSVIGGPPLSPHVPYARYMDIHLHHHSVDHLTKPGLDPESFYFTPSEWQRLSPFMRRLHTFNMTLLGRMIVGPLMDAMTSISADFWAILNGDKRIAAIWLGQAGLVTALFVLLGLYGITWWQYILFCVYPASGLMRVRSFLEHRPGPTQSKRTAIVESGWFWSLLFLNNNLHVVHHDRPRIPWYQIPAYYRANKAAIAKKNGGYVMPSYGAVFRNYFFKPLDVPVHLPIVASGTTSPAITVLHESVSLPHTATEPQI